MYAKFVFLQNEFVGKIFIGNFFAKHYFLAKICFGWTFFVGPIFSGNFLWRNFFCAKSFIWVNVLAIYFWLNFLFKRSLWQLEYALKGPRTLPLKFDQNCASNSWDIANMDKCRQDKCCMGKWLFENCFRLPRVNG